MINLIVAHDRNRVIGNKGNMPWGKLLKSDLEWFKENTTGRVVVMGRKTYESIGRSLPNRSNVVLSKNEVIGDCVWVKSIEEIEKRYGKMGTFIIGGSTLYNYFLPKADYLYVTQIDAEFDGDTYFPEYDKSKYETVYEKNLIDAYPLKFKILRLK